MPSLTKTLTLLVGARNSPLSQAQYKEALDDIRAYHPHIKFQPTWLSTTGDQDLKTSLCTLDKTDFFTKEIDELLLTGKCRIGIHSAKDLPNPLPEGLRIVAITRGVDPSDALVLRPGETLESLPSGAKIATSSERREEAVKKLRHDFYFVDIRGNIGQRLEKLENGEVDGIVIAEAALIRLNLEHINRISLPGETVPYQGQLAVLAQENDAEMQEIFSCLDTRKTLLHLGLEPPKDDATKKILHYPVIRIVPRDPQLPETCAAFRNLPNCTHIIFTSKSAVDIFFEWLPHHGLDPSLLENKSIVVVGKKTSQRIQEKGATVAITPEWETAEGILQELQKLDLSKTHFFWPHSSLSRPVLSNFFKQKRIPLEEVILYDTHPYQPGPLPPLDSVDEITFTSPSTVDAFLEFYEELPKDKTIIAIGPVTTERLRRASSG